MYFRYHCAIIDITKEGDTIITFLVDAYSALGVLLCSFYIFFKSLKYNPRLIHKVFLILWCMLGSIIYAISTSWMLVYFMRPILCVLSVLIVFFLTKIAVDTIISAFLLSFGISYFLYYVATIIVGVISSPLASGEYTVSSYARPNQPLYIFIFTIIALLQILLSYFLFRIKRIRNGFPFLFKGYAVIIVFISVGIMIISVTIVKIFYENNDTNVINMFVAGILIVGVGMYLWIRKGISKFQRQNTMRRNIEILEQAVIDEKEKNEKLKRKLEVMQVANHKIIRRLEAMEYAISLQSKSEYNLKECVTVEDIKALQCEYHENISQIKEPYSLPSTKIKELDHMFEYFANIYYSNTIEFNLKIYGSIPYMVEHILEKCKLETIIGDLLQNAKIAINASDNSLRSILTVIGLVDGCYELTVWDSGIPFEIETLIQLGNEYITTYTEAGGSGIGFATIFQIIRECNASLIIKEKVPRTSDYSKSISIRFDNKNQYIIDTYRPNKFPSCGRYVVMGNEHANLNS